MGTTPGWGAASLPPWPCGCWAIRTRPCGGARRRWRWAQELAHPFTLGLALQHAARLHQLRREVALTHARVEALIALATEQGFAMWMARGPILRGWALAEQGQAADGLAQIRQGLAAWQAMGSRHGCT